MGRTRRQLFSGKVYEITPRLREGLPFVCAEYMKTLIEGILARVQRDAKVTLCHYVGMANHFHFIVVVKDKQQAVNFVQEFKKKSTEALKRLHGKNYLTIWEPNTVPILLPTQADVEERIRYIYCNPANAHLVESIKEYPGVSSWEAFCKASSAMNAQVITSHPWVCSPAIPLVTKGVSPMGDKALTNSLKACSKSSHDLIVEPYAWLRAFEQKEIEGIKKRILETIQMTEEALRNVRREKKHGVFSASRLRNEVPLITDYIPKKKGRKIFVICHDKALRKYLIAQFKDFCVVCRRCYEALCRGETVQWPPAAFLPPWQGGANALCW